MSQNKLKFLSKENPSDSEVNEIRYGLRSYNDAFVSRKESVKVLVSCRNSEDQLIGGAYGIIQWDWLHVDLLWVHEDYRHKGLGSKLMAEITDKARERKIFRFKLETASFQALDFYKKLGFTVFGTLEDLPPGYTNYLLSKVDSEHV
jgi:ribosomal protein S18 acetylase RimI-like enzyme